MPLANTRFASGGSPPRPGQLGWHDGNRAEPFARALSDGVALAYLADVYVLAEHRHRGLGQALLREMIDNGPGRDFRWMLRTDDAHGLYRKFGFAAPGSAFMERVSDRGHRSDRGLAAHRAE